MLLSTNKKNDMPRHDAAACMNDSELAAKWGRACARLRVELGDAKFDSWFARLELDRLQDGAAQLSVPTKFLKSWIQTHYIDRIRDVLALEFGFVDEVQVLIRGNARIAPPRGVEDSAALERAPLMKVEPAAAAKGGLRSSAVPLSADKSQFSGSPLDRRMTFEAFRVGPSNQMAHAACRGILEQEPGAPVLFNPLYIHANVGLGKTHLAQAVAHEVQIKGRRVTYLTAEKFMYGFVNALRSQNANAFKEALRAIDILIIDDVQFLNGKIIQQEFGHVLNSLLDAGRQVIVTADRPPLDLESLDDRLRSRLSGGLSLEIGALDETLRMSILSGRVAAAQAQTPAFDASETVLRYVAHTIDTNGRDLEGAVNRLVARVALTGAPLTIETAEAAIRDLVRTRDPKKVKIEDIQKLVASHYNVSRADILSSRRTASVVRPRQVAMFLSKVLTPRSLPEIGRRFGGRDHTTVLHAVRKIEGLSANDRALAQDLEFLKRMLTEL